MEYILALSLMGIMIVSFYALVVNHCDMMNNILDVLVKIILIILFLIFLISIFSLCPVEHKNENQTTTITEAEEENDYIAQDVSWQFIPVI